MEKWKTIQEYVDLQTGEKLTKQKAEQDYIISKKTKNYERNEYWEPTRGGGKIRKTIHTRRIINECTKQGKQCKLFSD